MMISERIQAVIHALEVGGARRLNYVTLAVAVFSLAFWYDIHCYHNFNSPEAMDAAQVARNLAEGKGFTTECIRPFSVHLLLQHNHVGANQLASTNTPNLAQLDGRHPDLANAPLYPLVLAGMFKLFSPDWTVDTHGSFWSEGGHFARFKPEFFIAVFNQFLLLVAVCLTFLVAKTIFDAPAAWLAAILMLGSDVLWKFSVSGLPTLLLLVIFLGLIWCLAAFEVSGPAENPAPRGQFRLAVAAGLLTAVGMLTKYSFGWVIIPVMIYLLIFGGARRVGLAVAAFLVFAVIVSPWIGRNLAVSGTLFGTAGYAVLEGTMGFPGSRLMQSLNPDMASAFWPMTYFIKFQTNLRPILQEDLLRLGGGWMGVLFLAGLLLGLRNVVARRLRYFTLICLGVFILVAAMGRTHWSAITPEFNTENPFVLLTPLVIIFGVAFFLTLLNQMNTPLAEVRFAVVGLVVLLACQQFILTLLPPKTTPTAYPPYYPPEIQKIAGWMKPDELVMSDIPWAVAWYGQKQCTWTTINSQYEFFQFYDYVKRVNALYLTLNTLDAKLFTECLQGGVDSWPNFVLKTVTFNQIPPQFPLKAAPYGLGSGLVLADRQRWESQ